MSAHVAGLFVYPLKSAAGIALNELALDAWGGVHDRRWMLIDGNRRFITQREHGTLAFIRPALERDALVLHADGADPLRVREFTSPDEAHGASETAVIWDDTVPVLDAGDQAAAWCSHVGGESCRLVQIAGRAMRPLKPKYAGSVAPEGRYTTLSDGAPLLVLGEGSLETLNERLAAKGIASVGMDRFRPNIVLAGIAPHEEDSWRTIQVGDVVIGVGAPCPRCVITTIEQSTGKRSAQQVNEAGGEPLRTLAQYRRQAGGVMFGMNATHATIGTVRVGDPVTVLELR